MTSDIDLFRTMLNNVFNRIQKLRKTANPIEDNACFKCQEIFLDEAKVYTNKCGELIKQKIEELKTGGK